MTTRYEEIKKFMTDSFVEVKIEDTPENRLAFLLGLQQAWEEDSDISLEKSMYKLTLSMMISATKMAISLKF